MRRKILLVVGLLIVVLGGAAVAYMGPRNIIGMLRYDQRREGDLHPGDPAPDVALVGLDGSSSEHLRAHLGARPLVLIFGSFT